MELQLRRINRREPHGIASELGAYKYAVPLFFKYVFPELRDIILQPREVLTGNTKSEKSSMGHQYFCQITWTTGPGDAAQVYAMHVQVLQGY